MTAKKEIKQPENGNDKRQFSTYVSQEAIDNCRKIAEEKDWSISQVIDKAMKNAKVEDFK